MSRNIIAYEHRNEYPFYLFPAQSGGAYIMGQAMSNILLVRDKYLNEGRSVILTPRISTGSYIGPHSALSL